MHDHYTLTMLPGHLPKISQCKTVTKNASHATENYGLYQKITGSDTENNILAQNNDTPHFKRVPVIVIP